MQKLNLDIERLERRQLLAGIVNVSVSSAGDVTVTGDNQGNEVELDKDLNGIYLRGVAGTQIRSDGQTLSQIQIGETEFASNVTVRLRGGDDVLNFTSGMSFSRSLQIDLGSGNDRMAMPESQTGAIHIKRDLEIRSGTGLDILQIERLEVDGAAKFDLRGSVNGLQIDQFDSGRDVEIDGRGGVEWINIEDATLRGSIDINTRSGADIVMLQESDVSGDVTVNLGSARGPSYGGSVDAVIVRSDYSATIEGDLSISAGAGDHFVHLVAEDESQMTIAGTLNIVTRGGTDDIHLDAQDDSRFDIEGTIRIDSGSGDDEIHFDIDSQYPAFNQPIEILTRGGDDFMDLDELRTSASLHVDMGGGDDFLGLLDTRTRLLDVDLGGGKDRLSGVDAVFAGNTLIDGGGGYDKNQLNIWSRILPATVEFVNFEE